MIKLIVKFFGFIFSSSKDPAVNRTKKKLIANPEAAFEEIVNTIGSSTGRISLKAAPAKAPVLSYTDMFTYTALDRNGQEVKGEIAGSNETEVISKLRTELQYYPISVSRQKAPQASGFTLIELLVVIVILGIVVSLAAGALSRVQDQEEEYSPEREVFELRQTVESLRAENAALQKLMISKLAAPEAVK